MREPMTVVRAPRSESGHSFFLARESPAPARVAAPPKREGSQLLLRMTVV